MRIKEIISQHRRDFTAIYECEHCGHTHESKGYDDDYFHREVVPDMELLGVRKTDNLQSVGIAELLRGLRKPNERNEIMKQIHVNPNNKKYYSDVESIG